MLVSAANRHDSMLVEPLIPAQPPAVHGRTGRPRVSDRDVLEGIAFVLSTGIGWAKLPTELGYGSGWTCWRRMREWAEAGPPVAPLTRLCRGRRVVSIVGWRVTT